MKNELNTYKAKFISSSNKMMEANYGGLYGTIYLDKFNHIVNFNTFSTAFHTSVVKSMEQDDKIVKFETLNSVYIFELDDDIILNENDIIETNDDKIKILDFFNSGKSKIFYCHTIKHEMSTVTLPFEMTRKEANKFNRNKKLKDNYNNDIVNDILLPINDNNFLFSSLILNEDIIDENGNKDKIIFLESIDDKDIIKILKKHTNKKEVNLKEFNELVENIIT